MRVGFRKAAPYAAVLLLLLPVVPSTSGQTEPGYEFRIESDEVPVEGYSPVNESFDRHAELVVECLAPQGASPVPREFALSASINREGVSVTVSPATVAVVLDVAACTGGDAVTHNVTVSVTIGSNVGAATNIEIDLTATDQDGRTQHLVWEERAGPIIESEVRFREDRVKSGPNNQIRLPIEISIKGNANVQFQFAVDEWSSDQLNVALPPPVIVSTEEPDQTIPIDIQTPFENGYIDRVDELSINVTRVWVDDTSFKTNLGSINATIETVGTFLPGPSAAFAGAALVGFLAFVARRRPHG